MKVNKVVLTYFHESLNINGSLYSTIVGFSIHKLSRSSMTGNSDYFVIQLFYCLTKPKRTLITVLACYLSMCHNSPGDLLLLRGIGCTKEGVAELFVETIIAAKTSAFSVATTILRRTSSRKKKPFARGGLTLHALIATSVTKPRAMFHVNFYSLFVRRKSLDKFSTPI